MGVYFFFFVLIYLGIVVMAIGAYIAITGIRIPSHSQISGRVNQVIYTSLKERGLERIRSGQLHTSEERFLSVLDRLKDMLGSQGDLPEIGYDALFFHCRSENEANEKLRQINEVGLQCSIVQNKNDWQIKIDF